MSNDKSAIERKYLLMENEVLKKKLESEAACNQYQHLLQEHQHCRARQQQIELEHADALRLLDKFQE